MGLDPQEMLRVIVELAGGSGASGYILARAAEGLDALPPSFSTAHGAYHVTQPRTELELRRTLLRSNGAPVLALLDDGLAQRLPADLVRGARKGQVLEIDPNAILQLALSTNIVGTDDPRIHRLALAYATQLRELMKRRTLPTVVDRKLLDELLLDVVVGEGIRSIQPGELLARWIRSPPAWDEDTRHLVRTNLPVLHGAEGKLLAWGLERADRLRTLVVRGALLDVGEDLPPAIWGDLLGLTTQLGFTQEVLRVTVAGLARDALQSLEADAAPLLAEAETVGRSRLKPSELARSMLLPLGLDTLAAGIAERLKAGQPVPGSELKRLREHHAAPSRANDLDTLEEMARLERYATAPLGDAASLPEHVARYQRHGAFADLAAARLQRHLASSHAFSGQARVVLGRWRERRDAENRAFAELLARGYAPALKAGEVVPLHRVWTEVALKRQGPLYVVVMDGCSYPVFLELVEELTQAPGGFGLEFDAGLGRAAGIPALAPLPTITSHARSALFLGDIPKDPLLAETVWRDQKERTTDPGRFNQNAALGSRTRKLFLKGDLADGGDALLQALRDPRLAVVATVFNAVDDQIGSANTGALLQVKPSLINAFLPSLRVAAEAGRAILLTADHGHTPFHSKEERAGAGESARYCELGPDRSAPEGFLEIDLAGTGGTPGRKAFAWRMGAYLGSPQVGFHGGCSLEEMAVPLAWLKKGGVAADGPAWWYPSGEPAALAPEPQRAPALSPASAPRRQAELFDPNVALAGRVEGLELAQAVLALLDESERAALVVLQENRSARQSELAQRLSRPPARMGGFMAKLHRKLHEAGAPRFRTETLPNGEAQYSWLAPGTEEP